MVATPADIGVCGGGDGGRPADTSTPSPPPPSPPPSPAVGSDRRRYPAAVRVAVVSVGGDT